MPVRKRRALAETVSRLLESVEDEEERIAAGRPGVTTARTNCYTVEWAKRSIIEHALNSARDENMDRTADIEVARNGYTMTVTVRAAEMIGFLDALEGQLPELYAEWMRSGPQRDGDAPQRTDFADAFRASRNTIAGELDLET